MVKAVSRLLKNLGASGLLSGDRTAALKCAEALILGLPSCPAAAERVADLFMADYEPGTFKIVERRDRPPFIAIDDNTSFEDWVRREAQGDLLILSDFFTKHDPLRAPITADDELVEQVLSCLDFAFDGREPLTDKIYQQEYSDVFRRLNLLLTTCLPYTIINEYQELNIRLHILALCLHSGCADLSISEMLRFSTAAGLVGLNHKRNASATSVLHVEGIITLPDDENVVDHVEEIQAALLERARSPFSIDCEEDFRAAVLTAGRPCHLAYLSDDYFETVLDLILIGKLFTANPDLCVTVIPRAFRFGNDAGYADIMHLLHLPEFSVLAEHLGSRLAVLREGPLSGNFNGLKMSAALAAVLTDCDCLFAKGARSFECLQGFAKPAFFSFAVCRSISESVTGVEAESGGLVLISQLPNEKSFDGYRRRHLRPVRTPSGRRTHLAERTVRDTVEARRGGKKDDQLWIHRVLK